MNFKPKKWPYLWKDFLCALATAGLTAGCTSPTLEGLSPRLLASGGAAGANVGGASAEVANFSLQSSRFLSPDGAPFLVKGVNVNGQNWVWPGDVTRDVDYIANVWKFNLIRVNCLLDGKHLEDNNDLDRLVNVFTARKLVVLLAPMDFGVDRFFTETSQPSLADLITWHRGLASRYRSNRYVWFQVASGLGACDLDPRWLQVHSQVIQAIRVEAGAANMILADGMVWGSEDGCSDTAPVPTERSAILTYGEALRETAGPAGGNLAFSFQATDRWLPGGAPKMADYIDRVQAKGLPILVSAYGAVGVVGADVQGATQTMFEAVEPRGVGRVVWHWYNASLAPAWENSLVTSPNGTRVPGEANLGFVHNMPVILAGHGGGLAL